MVPLKTITESIDRGTKNSKWLSVHYRELAQKYDREWVAVHDGRVIAHGRDLERVTKMLKAKYGKAYDEIAFDYITKKRLELIL